MRSSARGPRKGADVKVGFIGAGKVGFSLGRYFAEHGTEVVGYLSRSEASAREAAAFAGGQVFPDASTLLAVSDMVFLTVPDDAIAGVWQSIEQAAEVGTADIKGKIVCHCSGACSSRLLDGAESLGGWAFSIHPLYAVSSKYESYRELGNALFTVEGSASRVDEVVAFLHGMGNKVQVIDANDKVRYHAAAVMASNLVVGLYATAVGQLVECGFQKEEAEKALGPLFLGNAQHIVDDGVVASLTGPAERGDRETIARHLACLTGRDKVIYEQLTKVLYDIAAVKHARD
jgi:predicted short-subunit dehydrogenase-like oxidoreductase (DUF2520 family)